MPVTTLAPINTNLNLATTTKWIAIIPLSMIDKRLAQETYENIVLNLTSFSLPEYEIGSTEITKYGYAVEIPTYVRTQSKELTFEYLLSSDWHQWKILYQWLENTVQEIGAGRGEGTYRIPVTVMLLSEFKKPIFEMKFEGCWIKRFGAVAMDYQDTDGSVVKHEFTLSYINSIFNDDF